MSEFRITKFHKRRKRTADDSLYYVAERFAFLGRHNKLEPLIKQAIRPHMKGEGIFARHFTRYEHDRGGYKVSWWRIYVKEHSNFMMLKLLDPVIHLRFPR
jgi:hypothetical protein